MPAMSGWTPSAYAYGLCFLIFCFTAFAAFFSISFMQAALGAGALIWGVTRLVGRRRIDWHPLGTPVVILIGTTLLTCVCAVDRQAALEELGDAFFPLVIVLVGAVVHSSSRRRGLAGTFLIAGACASVWALYDARDAVEGYRLRGTLSHYMSFAGLLMLGALLTLSRALFDKDRRWMIASLCVLIPVLAALFGTHTRSAWIGLGAGCIYLAWYKDKRLLAVLPAVGVLAFFVTPASVQQRLMSMTDLSDATWVHRTYVWRAGLDMFRDYPLVGVGPGNLRPLFPEYEIEGTVHPGNDPFSHVHNNIVQLAAERGLIGLIGWLVLWIAFFGHATRRARDDPDAWISRGVVAALVGFHAAGLFEFNYGDSEVVTAVYILMAAALPGRISEARQGDGA